MSKLTHRNIPKGLETGDPEGLIPAAEQAQATLKSERKGGKKIALGVGAVILTGVTALGIGKVAGGSETTPTNPEPTATATAEATPTSEVTPTPEVVEAPADPQGISVEKYPNPADAAKALEEFKLRFISGDVTGYNDYYLADKTLTFDQYLDKFVTVLYGSKDRPEQNVTELMNLREVWYDTNSGLDTYLGVHYTATLVDYGLQGVDGTTVRYAPRYSLNSSEIREDMRDLSFERNVTEDKGGVITVVLEKENGNWVIERAGSDFFAAE